MATSRRCLAGHAMPAGTGRICPDCRRQQVIDHVVAAETSLPAAEVTAAVQAVATTAATWRSLAHALEADPDALRFGAPPAIGRLVTELIARGSTTWPTPACTTCQRTGWSLKRTTDGALCKRCAHRADAEECTSCGVVKPRAGYTGDGEPICENCRRTLRSTRRCGSCGKIGPIAVRAHHDVPDICVNCYRLPEATCSRCGRRRPCNYTGTDRPICRRCVPRATTPCTRCGHDRPPAVRWDEGPLCDPCYTTALRHRGHCDQCGEHRRLVVPPGPDATTCTDCAGLPVTHACTDCGVEDKLYEKDRCSRCSLRRRTVELLSAGTGTVPPEFTGVLEAITATPNPRTALNWLRKGAGAAILAEVAAGRLPATHQALDAHPRGRAADYLRHILMCHGVLPARDEELARTQRWLDELLATITAQAHRRLIRAFASWQVMRRLRRTAQASARPRTYTAHARLHLKAATGFLTWLGTRNRSLTVCRQATVDQWLATGPSAYHVRDF